MGKLSGKIAIVTGASSGVGAGIAKVLAAHGASVVLCARRQEKLDEIRREIENRDNEGEVMTVACDVVDDAQIHRAIEATEDPPAAPSLWTSERLPDTGQPRSTSNIQSPQLPAEPHSLSPELKRRKRPQVETSAPPPAF